MSLCRIIGADFHTEIDAVDTTFTIQVPGNLSPDFDTRPELHLLEKQVVAGKEQIRMPRSDMLPVVGISVGYSYYGNIQINGMSDVGGSMRPYTQQFCAGLWLAMPSV